MVCGFLKHICFSFRLFVLVFFECFKVCLNGFSKFFILPEFGLGLLRIF